MTSIPCSLIRGGTSRGAYFHARDLPQDATERNTLLARVMGGPDALQIDGLGGGHPLTSKTAVLRGSNDPGIDVSYLFLQVDPATQIVSDAQNCGNILAGVGVYAIEHGWVEMTDPVTTVRVRLENTGAICHLELATPNKQLQSKGETGINGVPGTAAPIICNYLDIAGATCGALLPTGNVIDEVAGVCVTCIDNGMPLVIMRAADLGISGREPPDQLDCNDTLKAKLEAIRLDIAARMNLHDVASKSVPKMCMVSKATSGGSISTRTFIPRVCHTSIGVLGAVSVATACLLPNSVPADLAKVPSGNVKAMDIEHPSGALGVQLELDDQGNVRKAGVVRTARMLMRGEIYL